jgi:hypothetical protein
MRRWYSSNTSAVARRILEHVDALGFAMDLRLPVGVYRGFKVDTTSPLLDVIREGKTTTLEVTRNGGCSSWSIERDKVNRFSGASPGKVGIVVQLVGASPDAQTFIAPPMCSAPWFNELYEKTMGRSFRHSENEYAICAREVRVRIVAIKRK